MEEEYRLVKEVTQVGNTDNEGFPLPTYDGSDRIEIIRYLVQVKTFFFWHTVKAFKKILPAARLLHHLKGLRNE